MTFSTKAEDLIDTMLNIVKDNTGYSNDIPSVNEHLTINLDDLNHIHNCVNKLYDGFTVSTVLSKEDKKKLRNNKTQIKQIKTYMFLILYKLSRFYIFTYYNLKKPGKFTYLKDLLYFNSRHENDVLYFEIKKLFQEILGKSDVVQIIKELFLQSSILMEYLIEDDYNNKKYFDFEVIFTKNMEINFESNMYGDPTISLNSYFDFFENPTPNTIKNGKPTHDWLKYAGYDSFSAHMDLKNDVVLVECRIFQDILSGYFYHIGDNTLKEQLTSGACKKTDGSLPAHGFSIANFKNIINMLEYKFLGGKNKRVTKKAKTNYIDRKDTCKNT